MGKTLLLQELESGFLVRDISDQDPKNQPAFAALDLDSAIVEMKEIVEAPTPEAPVEAPVEVAE